MPTTFRTESESSAASQEVASVGRVTDPRGEAIAKQRPAPTHPTDVACEHCQLPVPPGLIEPDQSEQFCCHGCKFAWQLIHSAGLGDFYRYAESGPTLADRSRDSRSAFALLDSPEQLEKFSRRQWGAAGQGRAVLAGTFAVEGMHCAACVWLLEKLPSLCRGVLEARVNWSRQQLTVVWDPQQTQPSAIAAKLDNLGYSIAPVSLRSSAESEQRLRQNRQWWARIGLAAVAAGNNMLIAASLYLGMFSHMTADITALFRWTSCLVGLLSVFGPGRIFIRGAWAAIQTRTPHMDLPIALALVLGSLTGLVNTFRGTGDIYFDSLSVLVLLLLVGRWIQYRQQGQAADAVQLLQTLTPLHARRIEANGQAIQVPLEAVQVGDKLEVQPGERIPVDGQVLQGQSRVNESIISGESRPVEVGPGQPVLGGAENLDGWFIMQAQAVGSQTRIGRIMQLVEEASQQRPHIVEWANRVGGYFTLAVTSLALLAAGLALWVEPQMAIDRAMSMLIIACPCALALATPLAIANALGQLAQNRILVKLGDVVQFLDRPGIVWLDKTGTLTTGRMSVQQWQGPLEIAPQIAQIESRFNHPIANAFVEFADQVTAPGRATQADESIWTQSAPGGVEARIGQRRFRIGNQEFVEQTAGTASLHWRRIAGTMASSDWLSPIWISIDDEVVAIAGIGDQLRSSAAPSVARLQDMGWQVGILSGDDPRLVSQIGQRLGIDANLAVGGCSPEDKLLRIRGHLPDVGPTDSARERRVDSSTDSGTVVMVGDGVNDSAALAAAKVGVAVRGSAEASLGAAAVYLSEDGLQPLIALIKSCQHANRIIRWNLAASLMFNAVGVSLALAGWINPLLAAVLMPISSLTVIALSSQAGRVSRTESAQR